MRILDLFCGAGGASMGYHQACDAASIDYEIVGIDIVPQPDYPFTFIHGDALSPPVDLKAFDLIHASPPCQSYSSMSNRHGSNEKRLITQVRKLVGGMPSVIENVEGASASMRTTLMLCGTMFGLRLRRHRLFEISFLMFQPTCGAHTRDLIPVYGRPDGRRLYTYMDGDTMRAWSSIEEGKKALDVPWIDDWHHLREAIPPAYTRFILREWISRGGSSA